MSWLKLKVAIPLLSIVLYIQPLSAASLSGSHLLNQCQSLLEGSQSLMSAFKSGQCSSYILGIYDLVSEQCPRLAINRQEVVLKTLKYLQNAEEKERPAVLLIDRFLSRQAQCLPVASLN
ncbi:Rap1a/Tai family immunity protein [Oceanospirillum sediminis]|uniref:Rap1a immunity protein domain-containing protein n=1 Tax=Oceanospirillum sediminis TaxID=2760088 RepID=A0A839IVD5_9GAMM|nr:Rap1a/Tai family immunity protein [Oceanospirillum sediminis]MBB1488574.1 hypothetical protein [Oceanospirillum sediminis]